MANVAANRWRGRLYAVRFALLGRGGRGRGVVRPRSARLPRPAADHAVNPRGVVAALPHGSRTDDEHNTRGGTKTAATTASALTLIPSRFE